LPAEGPLHSPGSANTAEDYTASANSAEDYTGPSARNKRGPQDDNGVEGTRITSNPQEEFQIHTEHSLTSFLPYPFFGGGYKIGFLRVLFFRSHNNDVFTIFVLTITTYPPERPWAIIMTSREIRVCERLKRLGFTRENQVKLYGSQFELVSDPVVVDNDLVFVDAVEQKSGQRRRVRIPLMIVKMATEDAVAA
jgi:hypothetical protein